MDAQDTTSITRLQALRERWAMVRGKIAAAWPRVRAFFSAHDPLIWLIWLVALVAVVVFLSLALAYQKKPVATEQAAPATTPDLTTLERRVSALESQLALSPWPSPALAPAPAATPSRRAPARAAPAAAAAHAAPFTGPAYPQADAAPAPSAWGTTDLDRAIQQFTPPPATP